MDFIVTGAAGFVGKVLTQSLQKMGHRVTALDIADPAIAGVKFIYFNLADNLKVSEVDIPKKATIIHLGAISTDSQSRVDPITSINVNVAGTARVVELANAFSAERILFASSEWVYPELEGPQLQSESDSLKLDKLNSLYAMTKLMGENVVRVTCKIPYTILRFGIVFGPRPSPGSAPESILSKVSKKENVAIGNAKTARRFIFVDDLVKGICLAASEENPPTSQVFNLSGSELITLRDIFEVSKKITGNEVELIEENSKASVRNPDPALFVKSFGSFSSTSIELGLRKCLVALKS